MAWFTRITRFGDVHFVFGQEKANTCGPACALMCYTKINKLSPGSSLYNDTQKFQDLYEEWYQKPYDGEAEGTWPEGLVYALNKMGCGKWTKTSVSGSDASQKIIDLVGTQGAFGAVMTVNPIIVGVNWDGSTASHWVCIDTVRGAFGSTYATICDPGDAGLHVQKITAGKPFVYEAEATIQFNLWGSAGEYSQPATGRVRSWPIIHRTA